MLFEKVELLIRESERLYLGKEEPILPGQDFIRRHTLYPLLMVYRGFDFIKKELLIFSILYALLLWLAFVLIKEIPSITPQNIKTLINSSLLYFAVFMSIFVPLFLPPSVFAGARVSQVLIEKLNEFNDISGASKYVDILNIYQAAAEKRVLFLKRLYVIGWAGLVYLFTKLEAAAITNTNQLQSEVIVIAILFYVLLFGYLCVQAYAKSMETIFTSLKVLLIEKEACN